MLGISISMLSVQWKLVMSNKGRFSKLFFGNSLTWLLVFLGAINTLREFIVNERLHQITIQLCETFSEIDSLVFLWLLLLVVAVIVYWPKVIASYMLPNNTKIVVECCDLFRQKGLKVVQTTETFDTILDGVIKPHSVHGEFLQICKENEYDIDKAIQDELGEINNTKGKHMKMPLGTLCPLNINDEPFCLVAFTHWDNDGRNICLTEKEYLDFLGVMWENLAMSRVKHDIVNVTVLGNANLKQTKMYTTEQRIADMITSFIAANSGCCRVLHICVHTNNASEIDFVNFSSIIKFLYNSQELKRVLEH